MKQVIQYIDRNQKQFIKDLKRCVAIPSVSSQSHRKSSIQQCAQFFKKELLAVGFQQAKVIPTKGHPIVYAEFQHPEPNKPTVLIYGHYDVQPEEPIALWKTPPFQATVKGKELFGRGVVDDKGQVYIHLKALEAHFKIHQQFPLNVKFIIEGEEEIGSPNLESFLKKHKKMLQADCVIISDTPTLKKGIPSICYGLRGLSYIEVEVTGPSQDLHSGMWGGILPNPANILAEIISKLKDKNGRIQIPGFYKGVVPLSQKERKTLKTLPVRKKEYLKLAQCPAYGGEKGYTFFEQMWCRPTLDVNGLISGYTGEGAKTVLPSVAKAKISMRLVPHQDHNQIAKLAAKYIHQIAPKAVKVKVTDLHGGDPFYADWTQATFKVAKEALKKGFGKKPVFIREGGSIPFVNQIESILKQPALLLGFGLPDENAHAPNEKLNLDHFQKGMRSCAYFYQLAGVCS